MSQELHTFLVTKDATPEHLNKKLSMIPQMVGNETTVC